MIYSLVGWKWEVGILEFFGKVGVSQQNAMAGKRSRTKICSLKRKFRSDSNEIS
jgi:hypothetical protein